MRSTKCLLVRPKTNMCVSDFMGLQNRVGRSGNKDIEQQQHFCNPKMSSVLSNTQIITKTVMQNSIKGMPISNHI